MTSTTKTSRNKMIRNRVQYQALLETARYKSKNEHEKNPMQYSGINIEKAGYCWFKSMDFDKYQEDSMEFRKMRRGRQELSLEETEAILNCQTAGVLALSGDGGYPYAVPISYIYADGKLYFHCAKSGHKLDAIRTDPKASFCVIDQDQIVPEKFTTLYRSVIVFGQIRMIEDEKQKRSAIEKLGRKYGEGMPEERLTAEIDGTWKALEMLEMEIDHITGKQSIELVPPVIKK